VSSEAKNTATTTSVQPAEPKAVRPIYALFIGNTVSSVGDMLTLFAIPWFVLQTTGSVVQAGITGFFSAFPIVLSGFFGSVLVDRLGYKRTSIIGDVLSGLAVMLIPLLSYTTGLVFWQLLTLVFIGGLLRPPGGTARRSMVPELATLAHMRLERANALDDGVERIAHFLGAPMAGVLITVIGTSNLLWLDAASFAVSALLIGLAVPEVARENARGKRQGYFAELREGIRFVQQDAVILTIIVVVMITNALDNASFAVVQPAYMMQLFHSPIPFSILVAASGGMAFVGTVIFGTVGHRFPRRLTFGICFIIGGALRFWVLLTGNFPLMLGCYVLVGLALGPLNSLISTIMQEHTPAIMRARVFGLLGAGVMAGIPLGTLASGFIVTWIGLRPTLTGMGIVYLLATLSILLNPALKKMEKSAIDQPQAKTDVTSG